MIIISILGIIWGFSILNDGVGAEKPVGLGIVGVSWFLGGIFDTEHPINIFLGLLVILIAVFWGMAYSENENNGTNARRRVQELQQISKEYDEAVQSQEKGEPWKVRYATYPCPRCGHYKVRNANREDKRLSVAFWGAASNAIGKTYKCEHCGEMW